MSDEVNIVNIYLVHPHGVALVVTMVDDAIPLSSPASSFYPLQRINGWHYDAVNGRHNGIMMPPRALSRSAYQLVHIEYIVSSVATLVTLIVSPHGSINVRRRQTTGRVIGETLVNSHQSIGA